jgi:phosphoglycolate phosphatase-like HAD superfamily hydrolase
MKIALFDIDGTILSTRGGGRAAMQAALRQHFGTTGPDDYRYDGKTDRQIARELMLAAGFAADIVDAKLPALIDDYLARLSVILRDDPSVLDVHPGVPALLDALHEHDGVVLGLLTGNVVDGARVKLTSAALGFERFRVGAYGSDHERRAALPAIAQARASALLQRPVAGDALVIIGDTPHDLTCGRDVGARAIGVATGGYTVEELAAYDHAAIFTDLADTARVMSAILDA